MGDILIRVILMACVVFSLYKLFTHHYPLPTPRRRFHCEDCKEPYDEE